MIIFFYTLVASGFFFSRGQRTLMKFICAVLWPAVLGFILAQIIEEVFEG